VTCASGDYTARRPSAPFQREAAPHTGSENAPLSVGCISVDHYSYTSSAKCSVRKNKEWKAKESYATNTESYTVHERASGIVCATVQKAGNKKDREQGKRYLWNQKARWRADECPDFYVQQLSAT